MLAGRLPSLLIHLEPEIAAESKSSPLNNYDTLPLFTELQRIVLRDKMPPAGIWRAHGAIWTELHQRFMGPGLVEPGSFVGYIAGGQRSVKVFDIANG